MTTKKIDVPSIKITEICDALPDLIYTERVIEKSNNYEQYLIDSKSLYDDEKSTMELDKDYKPHMKKIYSQRFSNNSYSAPYKFYKSIRSAQKSCPYCNIYTHQVTQLDHFFPKSKFPSLSITPVNLVPICTDCNSKKSETYSINKIEMFIHPYFDEFVKNPFEYIKCKVVEEPVIGFKFYIKKLDEWDDCQFKRICFHFQRLNLENIYRTYFEDDFQAFIFEIKEIFNDGGETIAKRNIQRKMNSYKQSNSSPWLYAGYNAILESNWFFSEYLVNLNI